MKLLTCPIPARSYLTDFIRDFGMANLETGTWIAGGAARAVFQKRTLNKGGDIDIFCRDREMGRRAVDRLLKMIVHRTRAEQNMQATTTILGKYKHGHALIDVKVQVIGDTFLSDSVSDLFKTFDFTVCQFATDGRDIIYTPEAENDSRSSILRLSPFWVNRTRPSRVIRYFNYGFTPEAAFLREAIRLHERHFTTGVVLDNAY